jgi:GAF domain-containing protein
MIVNGKTIGAFMVYASIPEAFGDYEIRLFEHLAQEIAIGLTTFHSLGLSALPSEV